MEITSNRRGKIQVIGLAGRLDAHGAREVEAVLKQAAGDPEVLCAALDMAGVNYLSSAGIRLVMAASKLLGRKGGALALAGLTDYCRQVMEISGIVRVLNLFDTLEAALQYLGRVVAEQELLSGWDKLETAESEAGSFRFIPGPASADPPEAHVLGRARDVLDAAITRDMLYSRRFVDTEYSIGLGGLGEETDDYYPIMGEMMTIAGTMVWLPTDGNDTPDFLIPGNAEGGLTLHTAFNVSIAGEFSELAMFTARSEQGASVAEIYRAVFDLAAERRPDFKGMAALAGWAQVREMRGTGVKVSPVAENAPDNGLPIMAPENVGRWLDPDHSPTWEDASLLMCGVGADLTRDLSAFDQEALDSIFYLNPLNTGGKNQLLHNHGVVFSKLPMPERLANLDKAVRGVVARGDFLDMRHLLDATSIRRAFFGIAYVSQVRHDARGWQGVSDAPTQRRTAQAMQGYAKELSAEEVEQRKAAAMKEYLKFRSERDGDEKGNG